MKMHTQAFFRIVCPPARCGQPAGRPPRGVTLVELLVVVAIVAMILGLLTPALMGARKAAINAKVKSEIDMLHMALMNYKNEYGSFPPANFGPVPNTTPVVALSDSSTYQRHPVYRHLVRIFPRMAESHAAFAELAQLSPAQALVFWLRGFHENPQYPLTNGGNAGQRKKLYDFDESRLYAALPYTGEPQSFDQRSNHATNSFPRQYPVYFTGQPSSGLPYVYFDSRCYDQPPTAATPLPDFQYRATAFGGGTVSIATPYLTSTPSEPPLRALWSQCHVNADTFQLIASGLDGSYGQAQAAFPLVFPDGYAFNSQTVAAASAGALPGHVDNITNFAPKPLAEAVSALKTD